jgi:hypothetical protein
MKYTSNERGTLPLLIVILALVLVVAAGVAVYNVSKSHKNDTRRATHSPSPPSSPTASSAATATPTSNDTEMILSALQAQCVAGQGDHLGAGVTPDIRGDLAKVSVTCVGATGGTSGYVAILKKINGTWTIVYSGQQPPGSTVGAKYGLPADWYDSSHQ